MLDSLRIYLLQYATLLVEHAPHHIHDNNKNRNSKLRRLMTFAWPCLLSKACVDPACKYSGHLLLAHIIAKFAIHKKIVLQVPHRAPSVFSCSYLFPPRFSLLSGQSHLLLSCHPLKATLKTKTKNAALQKPSLSDSLNE